MNNSKRLIWCALLFGIQGLYFPLNRFLEGGMELRTALDDYIFAQEWKARKLNNLILFMSLRGGAGRDASSRGQGDEASSYSLSFGLA
jgi:hypothetical protein